VGQTFGLTTRVVLTDGAQPVGRGIGPALEARDVLAVLQGKPEAPGDLRQRAVTLAGALLELAGTAPVGAGETMAVAALDDGRAWAKFQRICEAQGGMRTPPRSRQQRPLLAQGPGRVHAIDNRRIARLAKLAGAPDDKAAGVDLHVVVGDPVTAGQPLCTVHADSPGELAYALDYAAANSDIIAVRQP
jgi:thymidine phosphorylase